MCEKIYTKDYGVCIDNWMGFGSGQVATLEVNFDEDNLQYYIRICVKVPAGKDTKQLYTANLNISLLELSKETELMEIINRLSTFDSIKDGAHIPFECVINNKNYKIFGELKSCIFLERRLLYCKVIGNYLFQYMTFKVNPKTQKYKIKLNSMEYNGNLDKISLITEYLESNYMQLSRR